MSIAPTAQDVVNGTQERTSYAVLRPEQMASHDRGAARGLHPGGSFGGEASFINGITEFAGGAAVPFHSHNCAESVVLLSGEAAWTSRALPTSSKLLTPPISRPTSRTDSATSRPPSR